MALYRNISGVLSNDVYTLKCDEGGCEDATTGEIIESWRPVQGSGVFPPVEQYPYEDIPNNRPDLTEAPIPVNVAQVPVTVTTPEAGTESKNSIETLVLLGLGAVLYMGMIKKNNNTEALIFAGGVAVLYWRMSQTEKQTLPVIE